MGTANQISATCSTICPADSWCPAGTIRFYFRLGQFLCFSCVLDNVCSLLLVFFFIVFLFFSGSQRPCPALAMSPPGSSSITNCACSRGTTGLNGSVCTGSYLSIYLDSCVDFDHRSRMSVRHLQTIDRTFPVPFLRRVFAITTGQCLLGQLLMLAWVLLGGQRVSWYAFIVFEHHLFQISTSV